MTGITLKELSCLDWENYQRRNFNIICNHVSENTVAISPSDELCFIEDHLLLWKYNLPQFSLYYSSIPKNVHEVLGRLWESHEKLLRPYGCEYESIDPVNFIEQSSDGYGLLASGPEPLIDSYKSCVDGLLETKKVFSYLPRARHVGLLFDCGYVIAQSIEIEEL